MCVEIDLLVILFIVIKYEEVVDHSVYIQDIIFAVCSVLIQIQTQLQTWILR